MYSNFTDQELVQHLQARSDLTPLEAELTSRLDRALTEVDVLSAPVTQGDLFEGGITQLIESEA